MPLFGNKKKRDSRSVPNLPRLDFGLTVATALLFAYTLNFLRHDGIALTEFAIALVATVFVFRGCKAFFTAVGRVIGTREALERPRNLRKFADQGWQLAIHVVMTVVEWQIFANENWRTWDDTAAMWRGTARAPPPLLRRMYIAQLAVWFYTAFSHKFIEAKHKDYFVMYGHVAVS